MAMSERERIQVYPRVGGGTLILHLCPRLKHSDGSIPAWAGEPLALQRNTR